jgi:hypothetical protein
MYAPVFFPPAPVSREVLDEENVIIAVEGALRVCGRYYAKEADAAQQRRWEAEKRVRERARTCAYCNDLIEEGQKVEMILTLRIHDFCAAEVKRDYEEWQDSIELDKCPSCGSAENDSNGGLCAECATQAAA